MTLEATVINGSIVLRHPQPLPEGAEVEVIIRQPDVQQEPQQGSLRFLLDLAGKATGLPEDFAAEHDHYLHRRQTESDEESMSMVFADSFYFFALLNPRDSAHDLAQAFTASYSGVTYSSAWVVLELADGFARSTSNRAIFRRLLERLESNKDIFIVPSSEELFRAGLNLYFSRPDKEWSLTDCISFVIMQREGITEALTGDRHFEQAGYVALLK